MSKKYEPIPIECVNWPSPDVIENMKKFAYKVMWENREKRIYEELEEMQNKKYIKKAP